jgi:hypothetical protein
VAGQLQRLFVELRAMLAIPTAELADCLFFRQLRGLSSDLGGDPLRKRNFPGDVAPGVSVDLVDLSKPLLGKMLRRANKRWPQATMNERDLTIDEAAHEDVLSAANRLRDLEDLVAPRMRPPASANGLTYDGYRE